MHTTLRLSLFAVLIGLSACKSPDPDDDLSLDKAEDKKKEKEAPTERFVIRDKSQRTRVDGRLRAGRMEGPWAFYDAKGEKLAFVHYKNDHRHGPITLWYVSADGPSVGRIRMTGGYADGTPDGFLKSNWPGGSKKLEREFDRGILQGAKGWQENGADMTDGEAMTAAIAESKNEDALLMELENFVQLQIRRKAAESGSPVDGPSPQPPAEPAPIPLNLEPGTEAPAPGRLISRAFSGRAGCPAAGCAAARQYSGRQHGAAAAMIAVPASARGPIDMHVHLVGNGLRGSGCWLRPGLMHRLLANWMLRQVGLPTSWRAPEFDEQYVELLVRWLRESAISHAVLLAHEEVYDPSGRKLKFGSFYVPNDYLFRICRTHPELLPAVSIHPARADALDELERCLEAGAVMLKFLPNCHNIDTRLPQYRRFWERMAAAGLPLLAHTGGEHTVPQFNAKLADPATLTGALECGVTVIAAHCATKSGARDRDYLPSLVAMMDRWPQLYADLSALNLPLRSAGLKFMLGRPALHGRLVHGSDFPVPVQPYWAKLRKLITPAEAKRCAGIKNLIARDHRLKEAMGFPASVFTMVWDLLRIAV